MAIGRVEELDDRLVAVTGDPHLVQSGDAGFLLSWHGSRLLLRQWGMFSPRRIVTSEQRFSHRRAPVPDAGNHTYLMHTFRQWLEHVADDPSAADNLATLIAQAGAVGVSLDRLRKVVRLSPETLDEVLKGLLASKQVVLLKVNGARVYRTA